VIFVMTPFKQGPVLSNRAAWYHTTRSLVSNGYVWYQTTRMRDIKRLQWYNHIDVGGKLPGQRTGTGGWGVYTGTA